MIEKTYLNQILPLNESVLSNYRKMKAVIGCERQIKKVLNEKDFQLKIFDGAAIAADLETDAASALADPAIL